MARLWERLTALQVKRATRPGMHADGGGLYLYVQAGGGKSWVFRYMLNGRAREMGLGPAHTISLSEARDMARDARRLKFDGKRGELRWSVKDATWEVLIPAVGFKNAGSSYFRKNPFRLALPDLGGLYYEIEAYIDRHRRVLLKGAVDPSVFFVKTMKAKSKDAAYDQNRFYEAWWLAIQRYGIYNPYTGHGAIEGLLPHGPHNIRDVLATHVLKQTGSYEQASYAIQDTPDTIAEHYGRFLPQDKAALDAQVLNQV